ncbi:hypothetical protein GYMLUDRAFT_262535 [Collybiopsis luxurians FD-317 M1]|uniref:Ig-like domain-containing protein n=1 Tax=Collybiopsis luxurians FD-317 M1 TaxID=944289 RepID=A0A0D0C6N8_9AGAR|nr:hypothetical protein GYMLUDRAFT_262535 [Collybiopsis luxurians FD-317 M1]
MPSIITPSRSSSSSSYSTPHRARSPPASNFSTPTITALGTQQKLNVVTRVAIEGKAKQNEDSVSIRMYLKMSLPLDSVTSGSTIQLFPEEHVKILSSQVHPLDSNSVPYYFDSTVSPLLNRAAHALKLPEHSKQTFQAAFGLPLAESSSVVDSAYTGHILVSGYHISYVLPKNFPSETSNSSSISRRRSSIGERGHVQFMAAIDMLVPYISRPPRSPYLLSIPTPRCLHNNISLRIFTPITTNVSSSFASLSSTDNEDSGSWDLASEPHVTRTTTSRSRANSYNSFADDESSDSSTVGFSYGCGIRGTFPSAERIRIRWAKPMKSLDTEDGRRRVGVKDVKGEMTCVVRGKVDNGVLMDVSYRGTCKSLWYPGVATMLGMDVGLVAKNSEVSWAEGFPREWEVNGGTGYTGFDVGLNQRLFRHDSTDSSTGQPNINIMPSSPNGEVQLPRLLGSTSRQNSTSSAASSTSSLLRAPLPTQNVAEYSFEKSPTASGTLSSSATESLSSLPASVSNLTSISQSRIEPNSRAPEHPITLHINMNELLPTSRNNFIFSISGTVVVTPRPTLARANGHASVTHSSSEGEVSDPEGQRDSASITLPFFTIHAAEEETVSVIVKNDLTEGGVVEVYNDSVSSSSSSKSKAAFPSQLQKGAMTKASSDGGVRILLKHVPSTLGVNGNGAAVKHPQPNDRATLRPPARPLTPSGGTGSRSSSPGVGHTSHNLVRTSSLLSKVPPGATLVTRPPRDGPLIIPWVNATVTPLLSAVAYGNSSGGTGLPKSYAVRLVLPAPSDSESDWLEFGLAKPGDGDGGSSAGSNANPVHRPPKVDLVNVSMEGVPVRYEVTAAAAAQSTPSSVSLTQELELGGVKFGEMSGKEWISWIRVHVGGAKGGMVVVDYVVGAEMDADAGSDDKEGNTSRWKGKKKARDEVLMDVYLPSFALAVGRLEVVVEDTPGLELSSLRTNLHYSSSPTTKQRLLHYSTEEFFYPRLSFLVWPDKSNKSRNSASSSSSTRAVTYISLLNLIALTLTLLFLNQIRWKVYHIGKSLENYSFFVGSGWNDIPEPITVTTTVYSSAGPRWWMGEHSESPTSEPVSTSAPQPPILSDSDSDTKPKPSSTSYPTVTPTPTPSPSPSSQQAEPYALIPIQAVWKFQWEDLKPLAESTAKAVERTLGPLYRILTLLWWGPDG